ncbi:mandelate racemase/muconate lactonizing enzyme family protein [Pikeienuella piscinae]|uniref:Mandelate racemase/muconate lactonizing enzyme family protein n=1 Tax=Pikeienuella piscinae TaxID=2748098 RepID=A0A7L5BTZ1_9RHOB|nr:mandelate racemase/muconate lactonizing enzyme family protein [Pikeienuella piscinae]QIE54068.1 mandelate racemase/muconate lactonizing enzyme family protein [Pikeienuella piscinae]
MKIIKVRAHALEAPIDRPFAFSQSWVDRRVGLVLEVETDSGITGWGDAYGPPLAIAAIIETLYAPRLIGRDPLAGEAIWEEIYNGWRDHGQRGLAIQALSAIDIALWDIRGKTYGQPVHRLMGGPVRSSVRAYATGLYRRTNDRAENHVMLKAEAEGYLAAGFTAMKTKVGFGFADDIALVEMLRGAIGGAELFVDANHGCDLVQAKRLARAMEPLDIGWFEEPVEPEDLEGYAEIRRFTSIPIAGGECSFTRHDFRRILDARAMDIIQPDTASCGGLTEAKRIADLAWTHGARHQPHVWGTGIGLAAAMQLLAVLPTSAPGLGAHQPLLEYDSTPHPFRQDLLVEPVRVKDGVAHVPDGPGLGVEVRRDVLERWRVN